MAPRARSAPPVAPARGRSGARPGRSGPAASVAAEGDVDAEVVAAAAAALVGAGAGSGRGRRVRTAAAGGPGLAPAAGGGGRRVVGWWRVRWADERLRGFLRVGAPEPGRASPASP